MIETRIGSVVLSREGYSVAEILEVLPHGGTRIVGYSVFGRLASSVIIYSSLIDAREALDDVLQMDQSSGI